MGSIKVISAIFLSAVILFCTALHSLTASADGERSALPADAEAEEQPAFDLEGCKAAAVYECSSGVLLSGKNEKQLFPAGHFSKLMTALIAAEKIQQGELSFDDITVCSKRANSQKDPQIWLEYGEKIRTEDLIKAICIGNANDAEVALCEKMFVSENAFTDALKCKAKSLFENDISVDDSSGYTRISEISAFDTAKVCSELVKHEDFTGYYTTWMETVRDGKAELVSRNRLIRTYKGIKGFKVLFDKDVGYSAAVCAKRGNMTVCVVVFGMSDEDELLSKCRSLLDTAFNRYELFIPEVPDEALAPVKLLHGKKNEISLKVMFMKPVIVKLGRRKDIKCRYEIRGDQQAPIFEGTPVGKLEYILDGTVVSDGEICSAERVDEVDFLFNLRRTISNLLIL